MFGPAHDCKNLAHPGAQKIFDESGTCNFTAGPLVSHSNQLLIACCFCEQTYIRVAMEASDAVVEVPVTTAAVGVKYTRRLTASQCKKYSAGSNISNQACNEERRKGRAGTMVLQMLQFSHGLQA